MPGATGSFLLLVAMPFVPSSFLLLLVVAMPGAPSSVLAPSSEEISVLLDQFARKSQEGQVLHSDVSESSLMQAW